MSENLLHKQLKKSAKNSEKKDRRRLLKHAVALPVIMTLHSGAALARSSNFINTGTVTNPATMIDTNDNVEKLVCVDPVSDPNVSPVDISDTPTAFLGDTTKLCSGNEGITMNNGIMISATAFDSISARVGISIRNI